MLILLSVLEADEYKYIIKDGENNGTLLSLPNIRLKNHFFVRIQHNNNIYCYDSNYEKNLVQDGEQFLTTPIQGLSDCFFFSMFFIKQFIKEMPNVGQLGTVNSNLKILVDVANYLIENNTFLYLLNFVDINNLINKDDYYFFLDKNTSIDNSDFIFCINKSNYNNLSTETGGKEVVYLKEIYDQKNIMEYCINNEYKMYQYEQNNFIEIEDGTEYEKSSISKNSVVNIAHENASEQQSYINAGSDLVDSSPFPSQTMSADH